MPMRTWKATFEGIGSHLHPLGPMQGAVSSAAPRGIVLCIVAACPGKRTISTQPPANPQGRAQAGGSLPLLR